MYSDVAIILNGKKKISDVGLKFNCGSDRWPFVLNFTAIFVRLNSGGVFVCFV